MSAAYCEKCGTKRPPASKAKGGWDAIGWHVATKGAKVVECVCPECLAIAREPVVSPLAKRVHDALRANAIQALPRGVGGGMIVHLVGGGPDRSKRASYVYLGLVDDALDSPRMRIYRDGSWELATRSRDYAPPSEVSLALKLFVSGLCHALLGEHV